MGCRPRDPKPASDLGLKNVVNGQGSLEDLIRLREIDLEIEYGGRYTAIEFVRADHVRQGVRVGRHVTWLCVSPEVDDVVFDDDPRVPVLSPELPIAIAVFATVAIEGDVVDRHEEGAETGLATVSYWAPVHPK